MKVDADILNRCERREEKACYELYKCVYNYLLSICWRYANDEQEAKHFLNTGFAKIIFNLSSYDRKTPFKLWIRRVTINLIIDELRKKEAYDRHLNHWSRINGNESKIVFNIAENKLNYNELLKLLDVLPGSTRAVFNLFVIDGYNHKEISEKLNISVGTSKWHVATARKKLQEVFQNYRNVESAGHHFSYSKSKGS
ncbi:MAG: sigma-70 family RNA polymerase sigma factor [Saprospiraceae bacterium]|nr:sigma-70 family RNA polymerase sigma factor [Saprospiraceae bacterium]